MKRLLAISLAVVLAMVLSVALVGGAAAAQESEVKKLTASDAHAGDRFGFSVTVSGVTQRLGRIEQVLMQPPAVMQGHQLHAQTNAQYGMRGVVEGGEQSQLEALSVGIDEVSFFVYGLAEGGRVRIIAAAEDEAVAQLQIGFDVAYPRRQQNRRSPTGGDRGAVTDR